MTGHLPIQGEHFFASSTETETLSRLLIPRMLINTETEQAVHLLYSSLIILPEIRPVRTIRLTVQVTPILKTVLMLTVPPVTERISIQIRIPIPIPILRIFQPLIRTDRQLTSITLRAMLLRLTRPT